MHSESDRENMLTGRDETTTDDVQQPIVLTYASTRDIRSARPCAPDRPLLHLLSTCLIALSFIIGFALLLVPVHRSHRGDAEVWMAQRMVERRGELSNEIELYRVHVGAYPARLIDLVECPDDPTIAAVWRRSYVKDAETLKDPWGNALRYRVPGKHNANSYDLWSIGPDGRDGGDDDLCNWQSG